MWRVAAILAPVMTLAVLVVACGSATNTDGSERAKNSLSGGDAAAAMVEELTARTFTDEYGFAHECSEFLDLLIMSSWEPDTESWVITYTGGFEPGTRVFRFYEAGMSFEHIAGPPLAAECGVSGG